MKYKFEHCYTGPDEQFGILVPRKHYILTLQKNGKKACLTVYTAIGAEPSISDALESIRLECKAIEDTNADYIDWCVINGYDAFSDVSSYVYSAGLQKTKWLQTLLGVEYWSFLEKLTVFDKG